MANLASRIIIAKRVLRGELTVEEAAKEGDVKDGTVKKWVTQVKAAIISESIGTTGKTASPPKPPPVVPRPVKPKPAPAPLPDPDPAPAESPSPTKPSTLEYDKWGWKK